MKNKSYSLKIVFNKIQSGFRIKSRTFGKILENFNYFSNLSGPPDKSSVNWEKNNFYLST